MYCKMSMISHGKHNNLHVNFKMIGHRKSPKFIIRCILFFDHEVACISNSNIHNDFKHILKFEELEKAMQRRLDKYDIILKTFSDDDFFNRNVSSLKLLKRIQEDES